MTNKRTQLPRERVVRPEERGPGEHSFIDGTSDVQGHSWTNPAPPVDFAKGTPTHGGELEPGDARNEPDGLIHE